MMQKFCLWKAHLKHWSSTTITSTPTRLPARSWCRQGRSKTWVLYRRPPWGTCWGLDTSNLRGNFTGLRVIFLFLLLEGERILLGPGEPTTGGPTSTYSTRPSSTMSDILTPGLDAVSTRGLLPWCHRSLVSLVERRRKTTRSQQEHMSAIT